MSKREELARLLQRDVADPVVRERLAAYLALLEEWNRVHNLVRVRSREELVRRHAVEALAAAPALAAQGGVLVDVGSGGGVPGIPLLVAFPGWSGILVEPRQKRWAFLNAAVRELGLNAEVVARRYQELGPFAEKVGAVCARALGGHRELAEWARPRLAGAGKVLLWVTVDDVQRMAEWPGWRVVSSPLPGLSRGRLAELQPCFT